MIAYDSGCCFRGASESQRPRVLWELTTKCNLSCGFCHARSLVSAGLAFPEIAEGLYLLKTWGVRGVIFSGGEPLLREDCLEIIATASKLGLEVDLCTNGTLIDDDTAIRLKDWLAEVSVSLDSAKADIHNRLRGRPDAWDRAVTGIQRLVNQGIEVHAITLVCDDTCPTIEDTIRFLRNLQVQSVTLLGLIPVETADASYRLSPEARATLTEKIAHIRQSIDGIVINTKRVTTLESPLFCGAGKSIWGIDVQGNLLPCILLKNRVRARPLLDYQGAADWTEIAASFSRNELAPYWLHCAQER